MGFSSSPFTLVRGTRVATRIQCRLDRSLCNLEARLRWPEASIRHLTLVFSDRAILHIQLEPSHKRNNLARPFRFLGSWFHHPNFMEYMQEKWCCRNGFMQGLSELAEHL